MNTIKGKKFIVALSGSIAAYKSAFLIRYLIKNQAEVRVIMTPSATKFISPLSLATLSKNEVYTDVISESSWNNHVELGIWADALIIAPATANTIAKMANGICDSIVNAVYLSAKCPVFFAPAMDLDMWKHPSTQNNISKLQGYGDIYLEVGSGELASGLEGAGRMMEPEEMLAQLQSFFSKKKDLVNKRILITAGPTFERIDPVRFIGNHSSGKMGVSIAEECISRGATVDLVLGPSSINVHSAVNIHRVESAKEMYDTCSKLHSQCDVGIFAAAVADYTPTQIHDQKIKKKSGGLKIELTRTTDIAASLGAKKKSTQIHVGFALETEDEENNALKKIEKKNFDFIVLNSLNDKGAGFRHDTNKVTIIDKDNKKESYELKSKKAVATDIVDKLMQFLKS